MRVKLVSIRTLVIVSLLMGNAMGFANPMDDAKAIYQVVIDHWIAGLNQKNMDVFMSAWSKDPASQIIDVNPQNGTLRISAGSKEIRDTITAYAQMRAINEFKVTYLSIQVNGDSATVFLKWEWGEWKDNLQQGNGNWGTARLVPENGTWKIHDVDFYSLVLKQLDPQGTVDISGLMKQVADAYQQKNLVVLIPLITADHVYADPKGAVHRGAAATQAALAQSVPNIDLNVAGMVIYLDVVNRAARVSQLQADGRTVQFTWKEIGGQWKLTETNLSGKLIDPMAVQPQAKRLTTWGRLKQGN